MPPKDSTLPWNLLLPILITLFIKPANAGFACLSNPCVHGVCLDDLNTTYSCYCIDGYTGIQCQTNWDECWSNPCQNGGICHDGIASFNCSCPEGFVGDFCEENFNECQSNPCQNNGTCKDGTNGYVCNCLPGYSGDHCEVDVAVCDLTNETRCANGGICQDGPGVSFSCKCQPGWTGFLCDVEIDECLSAPCQNGAICIDMHADYVCACLFGFTGQNCEEVIMVCEDNPCQNNALCLMEADHPICYCVPDYHGDRCQYQYDECQLGPRCLNGGTCIDGVDTFSCSCPPSLTGVLCECLVLEENQYDCKYIGTLPPVNTTHVPTMFSTTPVTITDKLFSIDDKTTTMFTTSPATTEQTSTEVPNLTTLLVETTTITTSEVTTEPSTSTKLTASTLENTLPTTQTTLLTSEHLVSTLNTDITTPSLTTFETTMDQTSTSYTSLVTTQEITTTDFITTSVITTEVSTTGSSTALDNVTSTYQTSTTTIESTSTDVTFPVTSTEFTKSTQPTTIAETTFETDSTTSHFIFPTALWNKTTTTSDFYSTTLPTTLFHNFSTMESTTSEVTTEPISLSTFISTTTNPTTTTHVIYPDCTLRENHCLNGGTCTKTNEGHKCVCPFDADGLKCENHLGIRNAAFSGDSFLMHKLTEKSTILIDIKVKTLSASGIIFYSNVDNTYMTLYIENGYLKFKFSCGFQTMLLSELKRPVNNGYLMNLKAELKFSKKANHCYATINLNNTLSMSGDQIALIDKFSTSSSHLYLGGIPQESAKDFIPNVGFIGCMTDLKVSGRKVNIFKDAEDGFEVSECSSLACLSNPCNNGASCTGHGESWSCVCKNGYSGKMCEISVCENNPCLYGGTCVPFTGSGYICLCPFGKHGHFCEYDMEVTELQFFSSIYGLSSYAAYPFPEGIANKMEFKFRFTPATLNQIAILLFVGQKGQHDVHSDHIAVSFVKGYIMLTWNLGSGPRRIFTTKPVELGGSNHLVQVGRNGRRAWLYVENLGNVTGRSPGNLVNLDVVPILYVGGHESQNFSLLPHDLPLHSGFSGCINNVEIISGSVVIPMQGSKYASGRALGQCGTTECYDKICQNGGACLYHGGTFTCLCQDGWYGPLCSLRYNPCDNFRHNCSSGSTCVPLMTDYECDCPIGKTGRFCEKEQKLSDVSFSGVRSYLKLDPLDFDSSIFSIDIEIRPLDDKGLILFIGRKESAFLSLSIQSNLLEVRIVPGKRKRFSTDLISIRSSKFLAKGVWHKIRIGKYGRKLYLFVDNIVNTGLLPTGDNLLIGGESIYMGGLSDMSMLPNDAMAVLPVPYKGCIRQFTINFKHIPLTINTIKQSRNVADCDGTPCGGEYCEHGGTCWLDPHLKPHCTCSPPYFGNKCQLLPSCDREQCRNNGKCLNSKCTCTVGFNGAFCENSITIKVPKFQGISYLIVNKISDKKRRIPTDNVNNFSLNFTTANPNGLLLWTSEGPNFLGIGLERGYLKLIYSWGILKKHIELPDVGQISDGLWHKLEVVINPVTLKFDDEVVYYQKTETSTNETLSNGSFYLGGIPKMSPVYNEALAIFHKGFDGCVDTFIIDSRYIVSDFTYFEGENINVCNLV